MLRLIRRLSSDRTRRAMSAWTRYVGIAQRTEAREDHRRRLIHRVIRRFRRGSLDRAFFSWKSVTRTCDRRRYAIDKILRRFRNVTKCHAFKLWAEHIGKGKRARGIMARVIARLERGSVAPAMFTWRRFVVNEQRTERDECCAVAKFRSRKTARCLRRVFHAWKALRLAHAQAALHLTKFLNKSHTTTKFVAWQAWQRAIARRALRDVKKSACNLLVTMRARSGQRTSKFLQAVIFKSWRHLTAITRELSYAGTLSSRGAVRHMLRIFEREAIRLLRKGFDKFVQFSDVDRVREEAIEDRLSRRFEKRQKALVAIHLLNTKLQRKFYIAWLDHIKHTSARRKLQRCVAALRLNYRVGAVALRRWRRYSDSSRRFKKWFVRAVKHKDRMFKGVAWRVWSNFVCDATPSHIINSPALELESETLSPVSNAIIPRRSRREDDEFWTPPQKHNWLGEESDDLHV